MFIIFGSPRSGTTLLSSVLNSHEDILIPDETDFIVPMLFIFDRIKDPDIGKDIIKNLIVNSVRFNYSIAEYISYKEIFKIIDEADYNASSILNSLYSFMADKDGKKLCGDKTPSDLSNIMMFSKVGLLDSDINIIHIIRDVRDVVLSIQKTGWVNNIESYFPRLWTHSNLFLYNKMKDLPDRYFLVKYEDIVNSPESKFKDITEFLGLPFEKEILNCENRVNRHKGEPHHKNINKPFLLDRTFVWKKEMDRGLTEICEMQASEALSVFGYEQNGATRA